MEIVVGIMEPTGENCGTDNDRKPTNEPNPEDDYGILRVIFNNPATIVYWTDGEKTVVYCNDNIEDGKPQKAASYSEEIGLAMAIAKKHYGNRGSYNNVFRKYVPGMKEREKAEKKLRKSESPGELRKVVLMSELLGDPLL